MSIRLGVANTVFTSILLSCAACVPHVAQAQPKEAAPKIDLRIAEGFTKIWSVRELDDGALIVCVKDDDNIILKYDANGRRVRQIGRAGDGPGEYRLPRYLYDVGRDSTLITGANGWPWALLYRDQFVPTPRHWLALARVTESEISGVDEAGTILSVKRLRRVAGGKLAPYNSTAAETLIGLLHFANQSVDTIRILRAKSLGIRQAELPMKGMSVTFRLMNPFQSIDQAVLFRDGAVAIAHVTPYSVDWRSSQSKQFALGAPLPLTPRRVTAEIQRSASHREFKTESGAAAFQPNQFPPWPEVVPPFIDNAIVAGADGLLYVQRASGLASDSTAIDAISRNGKLSHTYMLPAGIRLLAVTKRGAYVVQANEDDEEFLVRYALRR